jgi:DNA polymerase I-like protein with 3'-5' exonuclease and polymerase domains
MQVTSLAHAKRVLSSLLPCPWIALDTEGVSRTGKSSDALVPSRVKVITISLCHRGVSYAFLTDYFSSSFPAIEEYASLFRDFYREFAGVTVMHNANYDVNVLHYSGIPRIPRVYCSMIGCWLASEYREKGLKSRAPFYGRLLSATKNVDFNDPAALAKYAEEDVIQTDEIYQMQQFGKIKRPKFLVHTNAKPVISVTLNPNAGDLIVPEEGLTKYKRKFLALQELPVLRSTITAEQVGFAIDQNRLTEIRKSCARDMVILGKKLSKVSGGINLNSTKQLGEFLINDLNIPLTAKTKTGKVAVAANSLFPFQHNAFVRDYLEMQKLKKLFSNYIGPNGIARFIEPDGRIHCTLNTVGAVTGRNSSSNPNLQNQPSRNDRYGIKSCYVAGKNEILLVLDYSQLEIRVMAMRSGDPAMVAIVNDPNGDIHQSSAELFGVDRSPTAKNLNFLMLYGGGPYMLSMKLTSEGIPTSTEDASRWLDQYAEKHAGVIEYRKYLLDHHRAVNFVPYMTGRTRHLPNIVWESKFSVHKAETTLANNTIQGDGQDFLKASIIRTDYRRLNPDAEVLKLRHSYFKQTPSEFFDQASERAKKLERYRKRLKAMKAQFILQVHDENIFKVTKGYHEEGLRIIGDIMTWPHFIPVQIKRYTFVHLAVEGGAGHNWQEAKSKQPVAGIVAGHGRLKIH